MTDRPVALITGGARGIGLGLVQTFSKGYAVSTTYNSTPFVSDLQDIHSFQADLTHADAAQDIIQKVMDQWGRLDVLVNNAGAIQTDEADTGENLAVNTAAPLALIQAAAPHMARGASVINISSVNAKLPAMGAVSYSASKAALDTITRGMAKHLGPSGIRVNGIAPGAIERDESPRPAELVEQFVEMTALGRVGRPDDIAKVALFLASDAADFITGETITVSGGYRL